MSAAAMGGRAWRSAVLVARVAAAAAVTVRLSRAASPQPRLEPDLVALPIGTVTVVVPARNEAARIGPLLAALARDPTPHRLIVVDDESSDATAAMAVAKGAEVIDGRPLPPGWVGKPWALQQGLDAATGEWVVTLDADTVPRPGLIAALVRRAETDGWDLLTVGARFRCERAIEQFVHASMLTTLVYRFGPPGSRRPPPLARTMANGQCTAFRRTPLLAVGGFAGAAGHLTDDLALARHLASLGWRVGFLDGTDAIDVHMHDSAGDVWRSWGRSLPAPDVTTPGQQVADLGVVWLAQALPLVRVLAGRADLLDGLLVLLRAGTLAGTRRAYARAGVGYWASPLADVAVAARLTQAALRPEQTWRGRTYHGGGGGGET